MKSLIPLLMFILVTSIASAQKIELKLNAGVNLTQVPDFKNRIYIADGFVIPNYINIDNARSLTMTETTSKTRPGGGFNVEAELGKKINGKWSVSFSLGMMQMSYTYDTYIAQSFYKNDFYIGNGNIRFTYLTLRPFNVSLAYNRFSIQGGAIISYLTGKKDNNAMIIYNFNTNPFQPVGGFFEQKGDAQKMLFGAHINSRFAVSKKVEIMLGSQYFFNSLYKKENTYKPLHDKSKALQFQVGVSYRVLSAGYRK